MRHCESGAHSTASIVHHTIHMKKGFLFVPDVYYFLCSMSRLEILYHRTVQRDGDGPINQ